MALTYESLPPQIQQLLMQHFGAKSGADVQNLITRLSRDPAELAAVLQSLGINADEDAASQVQAQAQDWIDQAASDASTAGDAGDEEADPNEGEPDDDTDDTTPKQPQADQDVAEVGPPEDEADQQSSDPAEEAGEASDAESGEAGDTGDGDVPSNRAPSAAAATAQDILAAATGGRSMPGVRGAPARDVAGQSDLDQAIMELLSKQQAEGGSLPQKGNFQVPRPQMPHSSAATASNDPRMKKMIADIYRTVANQSSGPERAYAPSGDAA